MLPLPRPRPDVDVVRARLHALARGAWGELPEPDPLGSRLDELLDSGPDAALDDDPLAGPAFVRTRASTRTVLVAVGATALATWAVVHLTSGGAPSPVEVLPGTPVAAATSTAAVAGSGSPSAAATGIEAPEPELVVQVIGQVRRPGLVHLPPGSRVADAVRLAGGLVRGGSSGGLNLARPVVDGEQIVVGPDVPVAPAAGSGAPGGASTSGDVVVDLNVATAQDLDALPGVGPVTAAKILDWRAAHGRFSTVDQLREVPGIGAKTFERLKPHVRV